MKKPVLVYGLCLLLGAAVLFGCSDDSNNLAGAPGGDPGAAAITLNSNDVSLVKDTTFQLVPSVSGVTYTSSNPAVVTVAADGTLTAIAAGTARITVELNGVKTYCDVIVTNTAVAVTGMSISKARTTLAVGNTETLSAAVIPLSATNKSISWSSSDDTKASVDAGGKVTAVAAGEATITATSADGSKTAVCVVTVMSNTYPVESVSLNKSSTTILAGSSETLYASFVPVFATNQGLSWSSSDTNVATVEVSGRVRAIAAGSTTITITSADGSKTAACTVTVSATEVPVTGVSLALDKTTARIVPGGFEQLTATVAPTGAPNQNVVWTSSNDACATVDQTGLVKGIAAGSANITVTTNDGSQFKTCAVTVSSTPNKWRNIVGSHDARVLLLQQMLLNPIPYLGVERLWLYMETGEHKVRLGYGYFT
jgi:uncharacterized protein YjdB